MTAVAARRESAPVMDSVWRRVFLRCLLLPLTVTAPLLYLAPDADHRYNVYWHGSIGQGRPWRLVTDNLRSVPMYLGFGNFRPLGRMLEWSVDTLAYVFGEVTHLPVQIGLRLVSALAAAVLCTAAVVFAEAVTAPGRMFAEPPARPIALVPFAFAALTTTLPAVGGLTSRMVGNGPDVQSGNTFKYTPIRVSLFGTAVTERSTVRSIGICAAAQLHEPTSRPMMDA